MRTLALSSAVAAVFLGGCAELPSMSAEELTECLQPNRRVVVEIGGRAPKPLPKAKPDAPAPKPGKPAFLSVQLQGLAQGNSAFDAGRALLKDGGKAELDQLMGRLKKQAVTINSVIISGHTDRLESERGNKSLSEDRAKAVRDYLVSKGIDQKLMFWEGKDSREPVPVTKFCQ